MGIEKMSQLSIEGDLSQIERALMICCDSRNFQITEIPDRASGTVEQNPWFGT